MGATLLDMKFASLSSLGLIALFIVHEVWWRKQRNKTIQSPPPLSQDEKVRIGIEYGLHRDHADVLVDIIESGDRQLFNETARSVGVPQSRLDPIWISLRLRLGHYSQPAKRALP